MSVKIDPAVEFYDPHAHGYLFAADPRCRYTWGPDGCGHRFLHMCVREVGHSGRCAVFGKPRRQALCGMAQRPKDWDAVGRSEAFRP